MMLTPEILLTLTINQQLFTDPRRIALLKAIDVEGSLSQAAKRIGISYKTAWDAVSEINRLSPISFLLTATGGKHGGGTQLTPYAVRFIQLYDLLTQLQQNAFTILSDDKVPLDDILAATAKLSLQTSARNQLYGTVQQIEMTGLSGNMVVMLSDNVTPLTVYITRSSMERLKLSAEKTVILLIKAPLIDLHYKSTHGLANCFDASVSRIVTDNQLAEMTLTLASGLELYTSQLVKQIAPLNLKEGSQISLSIHPEHIIVATLI